MRGKKYIYKIVKDEKEMGEKTWIKREGIGN